MPSYTGGSSMGPVQNLAMGILTMGGGGGNYALPMMVTPSDLWGALAKSNAVVDTIMAQFDLKERYGSKNRELARKAVHGHMETEVTGEGLLLVSYESKDPELAKEITDAIVNHLDRINRDFRTGQAGATREFIEERLVETEFALAEAESSLAAFQKEYGTIALEEQTKVVIEKAAQLEGQLAVAEVELNILGSSRKPQHGQVEDVRLRIQALHSQLSQVKKGNGEELGLMDLPDLGIKYARLMREVTIQELIYQYLNQQYEQARIEEKKDTPTLQILSRPKVPTKKDRPKRSIISLLALFGGFILCAFWVLGSAGLDRLHENDPEKYRRLVLSLGGKAKKS